MLLLIHRNLCKGIVYYLLFDIFRHSTWSWNSRLASRIARVLRIPVDARRPWTSLYGCRGRPLEQHQVWIGRLRDPAQT